MSRIGKLPINIPAGVTVTVSDANVVTVKGKNGEMTQTVHPSIIVKIEEGVVTFDIDEKNDTVDKKQKQAFHGLYRALVNNMVVGVSEGYKKELELVGVGYRVSNQGNLMEFALGYTHPIIMQLPSWVRCVRRFVLSVCLSLIRVRVSCSLVSKYVGSLVSLQEPSNFKSVRS